MSIPKIVHYCWFGPKQIPENEQMYIEKWKEMLPDYRFILWNENNFDIKSNQYAFEAYKNKKFAFVADYVRIKVLIEMGGIYMDTDVELLKGFSPFLKDKAFIGFENRTMVGTGIIGSEPGNLVLLEMMNYYNSHSFIDENGIMDTTTNVKILNKILVEKGLDPQNKEQRIEEFHIYDRNIFCPKKINENSFNVTDCTVSIHHFDASWLTERERKRGTNLLWRNVCRPVLRTLRSCANSILGEKKTKLMEAKLRDKIK